MLKDVYLVFREYAERRAQAEYFASYQIFTLQVQKRLTATKLLTVMTSKDWRVLDSYLAHIKQVITFVDSSANYFFKSGLLNGLLKQLKKHLALQNRDLIIEILVDLVTKNSSQILKNEILRFFNVDLLNSLYANDRVNFVHFCHHLSGKSSKKYFAETLLESYLSILQSERYQGVLIALLKTAKDIRMRIEDPLHLQKLESFIVA